MHIFIIHVPNKGVEIFLFFSFFFRVSTFSFFVTMLPVPLVLFRVLFLPIRFPSNYKHFREVILCSSCRGTPAWYRKLFFSMLKKVSAAISRNYYSYPLITTAFLLFWKSWIVTTNFSLEIITKNFSQKLSIVTYNIYSILHEFFLKCECFYSIVVNFVYTSRIFLILAFHYFSKNKKNENLLY